MKNIRISELPALSSSGGRIIRISNGFTLVELLLVIGILTVLAAISAPIYGNWQTTAGSDVAANEIKIALELARSGSFSGLNDSAHGVYFDIKESGADGYTLYTGQSYLLRDQVWDDTRTLNANLALTTDFPGADINFSEGLGMPSAAGSISISDSRIDLTRTITINELGMIEIFINP